MMANIYEILAGKDKIRAEKIESLRDSVSVSPLPAFDIEEIERLLVAQRQELENEEDDLFGGIGGPDLLEDTSGIKVESKRGAIMYVDLTFSKLPLSLQPLLEQLKILAESDSQNDIHKAMLQIEKAGADAIGLIFREVRMFYRKPEKKKLLVELLSRLTLRSLKGRIMIKGVLQHATNSQHIELAIRTAGIVQEKEVIPELLRHGNTQELFPQCFEALLDMRDASVVQPVLQLIQGLSTNRSEVTEQAVRVARKFAVLEPTVIPQLFRAYVQCNSKYIRAIYTTAIRSFRDAAVPFLFEAIATETEPYYIRRACQLLGGIKTPIAGQKLMEALEKFPAKKAHIMEGLGYVRDTAFAGLLGGELKQASYKTLQQASLKALASCGTKEQIPLIREFVANSDTRAEALYALISIGDYKAREEFVHYLVNGTPQEQHQLSGLTGILHDKMLLHLAESMKGMCDAEAIIILTALQKPNRLPREVGAILKEKLLQNPLGPVRLEIYRLIVKYANSPSNQLLPLAVLYEAKEKEQDLFIKREIEQLLQTLPKTVGGLRSQS
jgi:hypothetical protein